MNQKERMLANLPYKAWLDGLSTTFRFQWRPFSEGDTTNAEIARLLAASGKAKLVVATDAIGTSGGTKENYNSCKEFCGCKIIVAIVNGCRKYIDIFYNYL